MNKLNKDFLLKLVFLFALICSMLIAAIYSVWIMPRAAREQEPSEPQEDVMDDGGNGQPHEPIDMAMMQCVAPGKQVTMISAAISSNQMMLNKLYEALAQFGKVHYVGECTLTAYCCERYNHICGYGDGLTATGILVQPGIVAVDPNVIPLGSTVVIGEDVYLAADTGGMIKGKKIDIAFETHQEALDYGKRYAKVWYIEQ